MLSNIRMISVFILLPSILNGQLKNTKTFSSTEQVCTTKYIFDSHGQFYMQGGCEGRGYISLGTYQLKNDKIILNFKKIDTTIPFIKIADIAASNDTTIKVTFRDRYHNAIVGNYLRIDAI